MAGVQAIIDRIIADATMQADSIMETARCQIAEIEYKTDAQIRAQEEAILRQADLDCQEEERRARAIADLESRKGALAQKRKAIEEAFALARQKILGMREDEYAVFLFTLLRKSGAEGGTVWVSQKDSRYFTDEFMKRATDEIAPGLTLGGVLDSLETGFILINGDAEINCTVGIVLKQAKEELEGDTARILFGGGD